MLKWPSCGTLLYKDRCGNAKQYKTVNNVKDRNASLTQLVRAGTQQATSLFVRIQIMMTMRQSIVTGKEVGATAVLQPRACQRQRQANVKTLSTPPNDAIAIIETPMLPQA